MSDAGTPPKPDRNRRRWAKRAVISVAGLYMLVCIMMYALQDKLIFPGATTQGTADARAVDTDDTELVSLFTADGTPVSARFCRADHDAGRAPTVLYFYGNGACAAWSVSEVELLRGLGCNVFVPDFTGYGLSGGKPSETGLYATATAAWKYLQKRPDIDHSKILTMGWSIGSAVAIDLASREPVAGLITISAFTRLSDAASHQFPWLPVRLLLKYRFDNASKLAAVRCPLLIIHGDQDTLVPPRMAETLADISRGRASRLTLRGAGHNTVFSVDYPALREALRRFIQPIADGVNLPADKR